MKQALAISNLYKTYANGFQALKGVNLSVEKGDFYALLGPNGAGKSTILGIVSGLVDKTSGQVSIMGHDIESHSFLAKRSLGVVPQEFNFNYFEQVENILIAQAGFFGLRESDVKPQIEMLLKELDLWDKRHENSRFLSGGMKRRLMIARALVHKPDLLILDEPTAGVDIELRRSMWEFMRSLNEQGTTIILTTHYLEEAEAMCRNLAIIDEGNIIEQTSIRELLANMACETFILDLTKPISDDLVLEGFLMTKVAEDCIEVTIEEGQSLNALFAKLSEHSLEVRSMRSKSNRLEELFVRLTEKTQSHSSN